MAFAITRFTPVDYEKWHAFHATFLDRLRREGTVTSEWICRDIAEPKTVVIVQEVTNPSALQAFHGSDEVRAVAATSPIEGPPQFWLVEQVEKVI